MEKLQSAAKKVVGTKAVLRALKAGEVVCVYVANDIDTFLYQKVTRACSEAYIPVVKVPEMKELGRVCGLTIACAAAAIIK